MSVDQLVVEHAAWIKRRARRYYSSREDADDLAEETIFKCLKQAHRFDPDKSFRPWVSAIMENTYITQYNRRKCVLFTGLEGTDSMFSHYRADDSASFNRLISIVRKCNRKSSSIECVMLYAKGYCYDEISERLKIPVGTVKSRISTGRRMLREALN